jgi:hypothetical protein
MSLSRIISEMGQNLAENSPQGAGLVTYGVNRATRGESGFGAYSTPLKLLGAAGVLSLGAGAYKGATNRDDKDNALIGGIKGMLGATSNFSQNVLMPTSIGVGALAATGFTRKFETGYMLTKRISNSRDLATKYKKTGKEKDYRAAVSALFPGGKPPKNSANYFGSIDERNAVDRVTNLIENQKGTVNSRNFSTDIISEIIERDTKGQGSALNNVFQGASSLGYAAGGLMAEVDIAIGKGTKALLGGKYYGKTKSEIKQMKEAEKVAYAQAQQRRRDPEATNFWADEFSTLAKGGAIASMVGMGIFAGAAAADTGYFGGSPINAVGKGLSLRQNDADYIYSMEQQKMGQYEMVAAYNPSQVGMRDTDDAYSYARSVNPSSVNPMNAALAETAGRQRSISPGQFGDTGSLVFAMNTLRRG